MAELPVSRAKIYIEDAFKWTLVKKGLPLGPPDNLLAKVKSGRSEVIGLSLGHIVTSHKAELCTDKDIAYADHYLQARTMVAFLGPLALGPTAVIVVGYETKKLIYERLGILDKMTSDNQCPSPVLPDSISVYWGFLGIRDGYSDYNIEHPNWAGKMRR